MTIYTGSQLKAVLEEVGFRGVRIEKNRKVWLCVIAKKLGPIDVAALNKTEAGV